LLLLFFVICGGLPFVVDDRSVFVYGGALGGAHDRRFDWSLFSLLLYLLSISFL
jgi:hypothetical protein